MLGVLIFLSVQADGFASRLFPPAKKQTIVIDPGHGGNDTGARGAEGLREKTVTLKLARLLAAELEDRFEIILTRSDDYALDLSGRGAMANHAHAAVFISLHTGGSSRHQARGMTLFHGMDPLDSATFLLKKYSATDIWDCQQKKHREKSAALAEKIFNKLKTFGKDTPMRIQEASLLVLKGADMPAVLVEVGYLSNPEEETSLMSDTYLLELAKTLAGGIEEFLTVKSK